DQPAAAGDGPCCLPGRREGRQRHDRAGHPDRCTQRALRLPRGCAACARPDPGGRRTTGCRGRPARRRGTSGGLTGVGAVFEPGFFTSSPVHVAIAIGTVVAVVSAVTGVFTVMRGQSFAGHALTDVATAGGSGAFLIGMSPLLGFVGLSAVGAGGLEMTGVQRARGRDLAPALVLGVALGLAALFLYPDTTATATTGATQQILFGSIFTTQAGTIPIVVAFSAVALAAIAIAYRPLLLSTVSTDIAAARGASVRAAGLLFMLALSVSVGLSSLAI